MTKRALVLVTFLSLAGCATLKRWWSATVDCASQDEAKLISSLPAIVTALASKDYIAALDSLSGDLGDIVVCDVAALSTQPAPGLASSAGIYEDTLQSNAAHYLAHTGYQVNNVPRLPK